MQVDINLIIAILGGCLSAATFFIGRQSAAQSAGREAGSLVTDLKYIKETVERIESRLNDDVRSLTDRIDKMSHELTEIREEVTRAFESAKSAHRRLDRLDVRDHHE